jgi:Ankyrin repeats (many copies)
MIASIHSKIRRWVMGAASTLFILPLIGCVSCPLCDLNDAIARNATAETDRILKSSTLNACNVVVQAISSENHFMLDRYTTSDSIANCHTSVGYDPTVLMIASAHGFMSGVDLLLLRGARMDATDRDGWTAVDWAIYKRQPRMAEYLISRGGTQTRTADDYVARHDAEIAQIAAINAAYATQMQQQEADNAAFMRAMQGIIQAAQARGGQPIVAPPYVSQAAPVEAAPPIYVENQNGSAANGSGGGQFDRGLVACITLGADSSGYYFQNNCGVPANIVFACVDAGTGNMEAPGNVNPQPGQRSAAPCFLPRSKTLWVACPNNDGIFGADGHSTWQPGGPYTCKRVWGHGL